jgi:hypothetical protein
MQVEGDGIEGLRSLDPIEHLAEDVRVSFLRDDAAGWLTRE